MSLVVLHLFPAVYTFNHSPSTHCHILHHCRHVLAGTSFRAAVQQLASTLKRVEIFYNSIGGLLGYHRKCLQIMLEGSSQQIPAPNMTAASEEVTFHMPQGPNLAGPNGRQLAAESAAAGLEALPHMAEIYPLGGTLTNLYPQAPSNGMLRLQCSRSVSVLCRTALLLLPFWTSPACSLRLHSACLLLLHAHTHWLNSSDVLHVSCGLMGAGAGDRLGLKCEQTGEGLPVAVLPYCGKPLLESLIRDVQAREYLYYKLHGVQQMTPIAIMTSDAKDNHRRVTEFINRCDWFGRGKESFR